MSISLLIKTRRVDGALQALACFRESGVFALCHILRTGSAVSLTGDVLWQVDVPSCFLDNKALCW